MSTKQVFQSDNPGRDVQRIGTARFLGEDVERVHCPPWGVIGTLGDSQCYTGVPSKVQAVQQALQRWVSATDAPVRVVAPVFTMGVSDGQLNGTDRMRYSLISREVTHDGAALHLEATDLHATIAVVACDKPPVGVLAAILEHNQPAIIYSDGSIRPGVDPLTSTPLDLVAAFQFASEADVAARTRVALNACPGIGSCGGMYTYNTMQTFLAVAGMEPLHMVSPASDDQRRVAEFPDELVSCVASQVELGVRPQDIVTPSALRNAVTVTIAMGGSTNVVLHAVELSRAAGIDFWSEVMTQSAFNELSARLGVLADLRPFGRFTMIDVDAVGGIAVVVKELLDAGWLDGSTMTCTTETLAAQVERLAPPPPDGRVLHRLAAPFKATGGLRLLHGNLAPDGGAVLKTAGLERGLIEGRFVGYTRVFEHESALLELLSDHPDEINDNDLIVIRYQGPRGAPGMPELLDPTSRITTLCRQRDITVGLMTDARFSGGSVGLVIGHVAPEAALGGPIALLRDGDTVVVDINTNRIDCPELDDATVLAARTSEWTAAVATNGGTNPNLPAADGRLLRRMRATARPALAGGGLES